MSMSRSLSCYSGHLAQVPSRPLFRDRHQFVCLAHSVLSFTASFNRHWQMIQGVMPSLAQAHPQVHAPCLLTSICPSVLLGPQSTRKLTHPRLCVYPYLRSSSFLYLVGNQEHCPVLVPSGDFPPSSSLTAVSELGSSSSFGILINLLSWTTCKPACSSVAEWHTESPSKQPSTCDWATERVSQQELIGVYLPSISFYKQQARML